MGQSSTEDRGMTTLVHSSALTFQISPERSEDQEFIDEIGNVKHETWNAMDQRS
jgi:hypothetical protein